MCPSAYVWYKNLNQLSQDPGLSRVTGLSDSLRDAGHAQTWLNLQCACISGTRAALLLLHSSESDVFRGVAAWPDEKIERSKLGLLAEQSLNARQHQIEQGADLFRVALPITLDKVLIGALAIEVSSAAPTSPSATDVIALLQLGVGWLAAAHVTGQSLIDKAATRRLTLACEAVVRSNQQRAPADAAMEVVNWLLEVFGCTRVSLGMLHKDQVRLLAVSHAAWFDPRSQFSRSIESAMDEAIDQRRGTRVPAPPDAPSGLAIAHRELAGANALVSALLGGAQGRATGAVLLERPGERPFSVDETALLNQITQLIGPILAVREQGHRWLGGRVQLLSARFGERLRDRRRPALRFGLALAAMALLALLFVNADWRITADAAIEGQQQRAVVAPFDGFILKAEVKAGETVTKGQALAELDRRSLQLEYRRYDSESAQHERRYRDALAKHDRTAAGVELASMQEAEAQRALVQDKLERALITAPFAAVVVTGDLSQQIGTPIEQGKVLFELAPLDAYRVILKVDEGDIQGLRVGQPGRLVLAGLTDHKLPFVVKNISVAEAHDGRNTFRVEASMTGARAQLRPGMQGVGKIEAGERRLLWIWTHGAWDWMTLQLWRWWP